MTLLVVFGVMGVASSWWSVAVLTDEDRYVKAITPLGDSPLFARFAGRSVGWSTRRRTRGVPLIGQRLGHVLASITRRSMGTRPFASAWPVANRRLHRERCAGHLRRRGPRVATAMVLLATMGTALGIVRSVLMVTVGSDRLRGGR